MKIILLLLLVYTSACYSHPFSSCDRAPTYNITNLTLQPYPPNKGSDLIILFKGIASNYDNLSEVDISVKFDQNTIINKTYDICALVSGGCPIKKQYVALLDTVKIPWYAPSGEYHGILKVFDKEYFLAACVHTKFEIV